MSVRSYFLPFSYIIISSTLLFLVLNGQLRSFVSSWDVYFGKLKDEPKRYCYVENSSSILFIHLTNETDQWKDLEMCAFKSAAVMNPDSGVCVLTRFPMREHPRLVELPNLEIAPLDVAGLFNDTPLRDWFEFYSENHTDGDYFVWYVSDALRYIYLYKYGGKYLDSDCLTLRNLSSLNNVAGYESPRKVAIGVLIFEKGHPLLKEVLETFTKNFAPTAWGSSGPELITKAHWSGRVDKSTYTILPINAFYPIHYESYRLPFSPDHLNDIEIRIENSYTLHLWRQLMKWRNATNIYKSPPNGSFVYKFLNKVCLGM